MKSRRQRLKDWGKQPTHMMLVLIMVVAAVLRLYRLEDTVVFQADQGRDALIVRELVKEGDIKLIGPVTSVGNMYLGPLYYYFMAPFMWLSYPSPMGPVIAVALLNVAAVWLLYCLARDMFDRGVGLVSAAMLAVMQPAVLYSRFSWNPNLMALMAILLVWMARSAYVKKRPRRLIVAWLVFAAIIQLHYVALIMGGWLMLLTLYWCRQEVESRAAVLKATGLGLVMVLLSFVPLVAFDIAYDHRISQAFGGFFTSDEHHLRNPLEALRIVQQLEGRAIHFLVYLMQIPKHPVQAWERLLLYGAIALLMYAWKKGTLSRYARIDLALFASWLGLTIVGTAFYTSSIFDHYVSFVYPAVAIFYGLVLTQLWCVRPVGPALTVALAAILGFYNLQSTPAFARGGPPLSQFRETAEVVLPYIADKRYNVLLISDNLDHRGLNYRYFFQVSETPPAAEDEYENLERLVVIDEKLSGEPFAHGIYELERVNFRQVESQFRVDKGPLVYILRAEATESASESE